MGRFDDRRVLVTGGSRGIGRALCEAFAREGADVATCARSEGALEGTKQAIEGLGRRCLALPLDITQSSAVNDAVSQVMQEFGHLDVLVNNAGVTVDKPLIRMTDEDWDHVMDTNAKGAFLLTRVVGRPMLKRRSGSIVNLTSVVGVMGNPGQTNYAASKAAVIGFTKSCAREFAGRGVRVNAVAPGFIDTDMTRAMGAEAQEVLVSKIPLGRVGSVEDVADAVLFLAGDEASYLTGTVLHCNGGLYM